MVTALAERIAQRIEDRRGHWLWTGPVSTSGTPEVWSNRQALSVRRWCWEHAHGELEPGIKVLRTCAESLCVSPHHAALPDRIAPVLAAALRQRTGLTLRS